MSRPICLPALCLAALVCTTISEAWSQAAEPAVAVRAENLTVQPSSGPVTYVVVQNQRETAFQGTLSVRFPEGWRVAQTEQKVSLAPGETKRVAFAIERATDVAANAYVFEITVKGDGVDLVNKQTVVCATAPNFKPKIDGNLKEWGDSVPIEFMTNGKKTIVRTYWNKQQFCIAVEVEEDELVPLGKNSDASPDAVQFAFAPAKASRDWTNDTRIERYEFLAVASSSFLSKNKCFQLAKPGMDLADAQEARDLEGRELEGAEVAVKHGKGFTYWEIAVPYEAMATLRATVGRTFCFSLLVHDPDGTGIRNLGEVMNMFPQRRHAFGWCRWQGAKWRAEPELDNRVEWGLSSSIH